MRKNTILKLTALGLLVLLLAGCAAAQPAPQPTIPVPPADVPPTAPAQPVSSGPTAPAATSGPEPTAPAPPVESELTAPPTLTPTQDAWDRVKSTGVLLVGTSAGYPPFEYYGAVSLTGFDVELIQAIGKNLGLNVKITNSAFDGLGDALQLGRIDLAISAITYTPERAAALALSDPYMNDVAAVLAPSNSKLAKMDVPRDLAGLTVAVQKGTVYEKWVQDNLVNAKFIRPEDVHVYPDMDKAVSDLKQGRSNVALLDAIPAKTYVDQGGVKIISDRLSEQLYVMAMKRGSDQLLANVNKALSDVQASGTVSELSRKYQLFPSVDQLQPIPTPSNPPTAPAPPPCINDARFIQDMNLDDNYMQAPPPIAAGAPFQKSWRIINSGTCTWGPGYVLEFASGEQMDGAPVPIAENVVPGQQYYLSANLTAPAKAGTYQGFWQMRAANGKVFGERVHVGISVPAQ